MGLEKFALTFTGLLCLKFYGLLTAGSLTEFCGLGQHVIMTVPSLHQ